MSHAMVPQTSQGAGRDKKIPNRLPRARSQPELPKSHQRTTSLKDGIPVTDWLTRVGPYSQQKGWTTAATGARHRPLCAAFANRTANRARPREDVRGRSHPRRGRGRPRPRANALHVHADIDVAPFHQSGRDDRSRRAQGLAPERAGPQEDEQGQDREEEPGVHRAGQREGRADRGHAEGDRGVPRERRRGRTSFLDAPRKARRHELRG